MHKAIVCDTHLMLFCIVCSFILSCRSPNAFVFQPACVTWLPKNIFGQRQTPNVQSDLVTWLPKDMFGQHQTLNVPSDLVIWLPKDMLRQRQTLNIQSDFVTWLSKDMFGQIQSLNVQSDVVTWPPKTCLDNVKHWLFNSILLPCYQNFLDNLKH